MVQEYERQFFLPEVSQLGKVDKDSVSSSSKPERASRFEMFGKCVIERNFKLLHFDRKLKPPSGKVATLSCSRFVHFDIWANDK
ncbi:hypothetical protein [Pseudoalteromonas ruthenica]|uniref:hypothetical protein n=1 Tax=Pseudoalteromonas ruthenica TaxID=151081 RepID=UPI00110B36CB|nr:hypothetical protein [Pseudoalteromonas ruthenica]TMO88068.1 hypothetical protein CWC12_07660 [Pseudoalteromonas ruthenica]TMP22700.1 hypothetical protein CWC06_13930 [Pseudoalteromonas ruthenica]